MQMETGEKIFFSSGKVLLLCPGENLGGQVKLGFLEFQLKRFLWEEVHLVGDPVERARQHTFMCFGTAWSFQNIGKKLN